MTSEEMAKFWQESSDKDVITARDMLSGKHYDWSLFLWHIAVEKALKSKIASLNKEIPYTHDLRLLAIGAGLTLSLEQTAELNEITTFNIEARYDDYKRSFYRKATPEFASQWSKNCENIILWIKNQK